MASIPKVKGQGKIAKTEIVPFTRQLASMIGAGMPILSTIQTLEEQCANPEFKKVLTHLKETIEGGDPLSKGLADFPALFDDMYVNMVLAGEQSGEFAGILKRLGTIMQATARLKGKVTSAMTYPTVIVSIALLLAGGLIQFVVPKFAEMFSGFGKPLPVLTQTLVDISNFVKAYWYIIIIAVGAGIWTFKWWKNTERGHYKFSSSRCRSSASSTLRAASAGSADFLPR